MDFSVGVHYKRTVTHNRLVDGFTAEDQQHRVVIGFELHPLTVTLEFVELPSVMPAGSVPELSDQA